MIYCRILILCKPNIPSISSRTVGQDDGIQVYGGCEEVVSVKRSPPMVSVATLEKGL